MSESTDNPTLNVEALTALERAATPAPWAHEHEGGHIVHGPEGTVAEAMYAPDAKLIAAMRNQLPALLAELAALQVQYAGVQMERDLAHEQLRGWRKRAAGSGETTDGEVPAL